jgi:hypothetical protein
MVRRPKIVFIGMAIIVAIILLTALSWWGAALLRTSMESNAKLVESREKQNVVWSFLRQIEFHLQREADAGVAVGSSGGVESKDQVNWTIRWDIAATHVNMEDPKSSTKQQIVNLRVHWRSRPDGEAVIEWGEAPKSREAAEMLGSLLETAHMRFSIREAEELPSSSAATQ